VTFFHKSISKFILGHFTTGQMKSTSWKTSFFSKVRSVFKPLMLFVFDLNFICLAFCIFDSLDLLLYNATKMINADICKEVEKLLCICFESANLVENSEVKLYFIQILTTLNYIIEKPPVYIDRSVEVFY